MQPATMCRDYMQAITEDWETKKRNSRIAGPVFIFTISRGGNMPYVVFLMERNTKKTSPALKFSTVVNSLLMDTSIFIGK